MSCRHCCINSKKSLSKTFSFHKIIYKYFAGFLACIYDIIRCHYEGNARDICGFQPADAPPLASNLFCADCFAHARNDGKNIVITRFCKNRSNPQKRGFINFGLLHSVRNDMHFCHYEGEARSNPNMDCHASLCSARDDGESKSRTRCAPHGDDNDKNFQFDKYWGLFFNELFSVIYKKNLLIWRFCL